MHSRQRREQAHEQISQSHGALHEAFTKLQAPHLTRGKKPSRGCLITGGVLLTLFLIWEVYVFTFQPFAAYNAEVNREANTSLTSVAEKPLPMPVLTLEEKIQALNFVGTDTHVSYDKESHTLFLTKDIGEPLDYNTGQYTARMEIFDMLHSVYTSHLISGLAEVDVTITAPLVDQYGKTSNGPITKATLTSTTEQLFNWDGLDHETAWKDYDSTWQIPNN